jgi:hypothetical protein
MTNSNRTLIDQLIETKAIADKAAADYDALKAQFVEENNACGTYEGTDKNVQIILSQRSVVDYAKLEAVFGVTKEQFELYSKCKKDGSTFTVVKVIDKKDAE